MKVTIGGDRLGAGNKNKTSLNKYTRSTHNLSQKWTSSVNCGTLYPFLKLLLQKGDAVEIDLQAACRTIPTNGPLFGSFKLQLDLFKCDLRLYQGILHNNPVNIGLKMNQVLFPQISIQSHMQSDDGYKQKNAQFANNCLLKYLGLSGLGTSTKDDVITLERTFNNAIPILAYYDIFKQFYANKQEENAYVITPGNTNNNVIEYNYNREGWQNIIISMNIEIWNAQDTPETLLNQLIIKYKEKAYLNELINGTSITFQLENVSAQDPQSEYLEVTYNLSDLIEANVLQFWKLTEKQQSIVLYDFNKNNLINYISDDGHTIYQWSNISIKNISFSGSITENLHLQEFELENIDIMRNKILTKNDLNVPLSINEVNLPPYRYLYDVDNDGITLNNYPLNGLMVKTYQADIYNTWINTEWIDGENGIAELTRVAIGQDGLKLDDLNLAQKLYNVLNRIAIAGNSYQDWLNAVYTDYKKGYTESPIYCGSMSGEVVFEEIIQTAQGSEDQPLGTLGGRGTLIDGKGGHIIIKSDDEPCYIIGILSLTPRINYSQGNDWDMIELRSIDDMHKPALDGIGFQNLIGEYMDYRDTLIDPINGTEEKHTVGKIPAWLNYMTAVDKTYGDFASSEGRAYMVLNREYESDENGLIDATTYIDPKKFNYVFAYNELDSQNFWIQVKSKITKRFLGSGKQIPNL